MIRIGKFDIHRAKEWLGGISETDLYIRANETAPESEGEGMQLDTENIKELEKLIEEFFINHM